MDSRKVSLIILEDIWYNNAYSNLSINKNIKKYGMRKDEAFIRELVYGVLENQLYIDHVIDGLSNIKRSRIHKKILSCLRLGIYQILFLDNIPDRAAVHESVELAKKYGNKGSVGYVNGLLRNVSRNKDELLNIEIDDKIKHLSISYSHPEWMVEYFIGEFGEEFAEELMNANNQVAKFSIRVNKLITFREDLKKKLIGKGYTVLDNNLSKDSLEIVNPDNILDLEEYKEGLFTIQDESSSLVGDIIDPERNSFVADVCAAPGGKTTHLAEKMNNEGSILARDIHGHRLDLIDSLAKRLKIDIIETEKHNGTKLDKSLIDKLDYCLVDAPCSGLGTIRRNPEIKYRKTMKDIEDLSQVQYKILNTSKKYVKNGGNLIYSTCTVGRKENENVIERFLENNSNFYLDKISIDGLESSEGFVKLYPNIHGTDGFFIAKLKRID